MGYVGLPLAVESSKHYPTTGFDIDLARIEQLKGGNDSTKEVSSVELKETKLKFTVDTSELGYCNFFIITVPTPVDNNKTPDLRFLISGSETVGKNLKKGDFVVYESTVFPGCTEEVCVPVLERESNLEFNKDFFCGYSPERINPGDKQHRISTIKKITSGSTREVAEVIDNYYSSFVIAGTYRASSIKVAEAAKVIENSQRDINIAFVNELALIFEKLDIDTTEVLAAAGTKWNFLNFKPGLVGGHCIGVDPYYLTQKAEAVGHHPEMILSGRRINDQMGEYVAQRVIRLLGEKRKLSNNTRVLILGFTFKENCPDARNTRVIDIYEELCTYNFHVDIYDPNADENQVREEYEIQLIHQPGENYDAVILAVAHDEFRNYDWQQWRKNTSVLFDTKSILPKEIIDGRL